MSGETRKSISGWTTDTLLAHVEAQFADLRLNLRERFEAQTKAVEAAFIAQSTAMQTALTAADKAVDKALEAAEKAVDQRALTLDKEFHEHLEQVRHENALAFINQDKAVQAAFASSKEAIAKSDAADEKRFASVNEFRAQLADQAATFIPRAEAEARLTAIVEKSDGGVLRNAERIALLELALQKVPTAMERDATQLATHATTDALSERVSKLELAMQRVPTSSEKQSAQDATTARDTGLSDRVSALERFSTSQLALKQGSTETVNDYRASTSTVLAVVGGIISVLILVIGAYATFHK